MSAEVRDWLAAVLAEDPAVGRVVGAAVTVLFDTRQVTPLIKPLEGERWTRDPLTALDDAYQRQIELLNIVRRSIADISRTRQRQEAVGPDEPARRGIEQLVEQERQANLELQRLQAEADSFRSRKEAIKAHYLTVRAELETQAEDADELGAADDLAKVRTTVTDKLKEIAEQERRLGPYILGDLSELRLGAADLRLLFATTDDIVTLLVVGMVQGDWSEWYREALPLVRAELRLPDDDFISYDEPTFLSEYFPGHEAEIRAAAMQVVDRSLAQRLAKLRQQTDRTIEQVAEQMRTNPERITEMEEAGARAATLGDLVEYVEALGGRLEVTAVFGTDRIAFH